jgi:hypothetical protein
VNRVVTLHPAAASATIRLRLASGLLVQTEGGTSWPLTGKDAALLAWLAVEGPTPRERLARLLWPESDDATARNALRQRIFDLLQNWCVFASGDSTKRTASSIER